MITKVNSYHEQGVYFKECPHCGRVSLVENNSFVPPMAMKPEYQQLLKEYPRTTSMYCPEDAKNFKEHQEQLYVEDIFDEDPHTTMTNLMGYLSESLGNDALLSILASLIGVGILEINSDKFYHYHDVTDDDIKNDLN